MSRIPTNVGQIQPRTSVTTTVEDVGNLGTRTVRRGAGQKFRRSIGKFFSKIDSKFKKLNDRIVFAQAKAKAKRQFNEAERAAATLLKTVAHRKSTKKITSAMVEFVHKASKLTTRIARFEFDSFLRLAGNNLSPSDKQDFDLAMRNWHNDDLPGQLKEDFDRYFAEGDQQADAEMKASFDTIVNEFKRRDRMFRPL